MRSEPASRRCNFARNPDYDFRLNSTFSFGEFWSESRVVLLQRLDRRFEALSVGSEPVELQFLPVRPTTHELPVKAILIENHFRHREQNRGLRARIRRHPVIGHAGGIR